MKYDVFISYSRKDTKIVQRFLECFEKEGITFWYDKSGIESGDRFKKKIVRAIEDSQLFIFFSSVNSNVSEWTAKEIGIAVSRHKKIIPVKLDSSKYNEDVEFDIINLDFTDYAALGEHSFDRIISTIHNSLDELNPNRDKIRTLRQQLQANKEELHAKTMACKSIAASLLELGVDVSKEFCPADWNSEESKRLIEDKEKENRLLSSEISKVTDELEKMKLNKKMADDEIASLKDEILKKTITIRKLNIFIGTLKIRNTTIDIVNSKQTQIILISIISLVVGLAFGIFLNNHATNASLQSEDTLSVSTSSVEIGSSGEGNAASSVFDTLTAEECLIKGEMCSSQENYAEAMKYYKAAATKGNAEGLWNVGYMYYMGRGVDKNYSESKVWFEKSAQLGFAKAMNSLGNIYFKGDSTLKRDKQMASKWYEKGAEHGDVNAQFAIGKRYYDGEGVLQDRETAAQWYIKAADQGHAAAQCELGFMYRIGRGVAKDKEKAIEYYKKAAQQGNSGAKDALNKYYQIVL